MRSVRSRPRWTGAGSELHAVVVAAITFDYDDQTGSFRFTLDGEERQAIPALDGRHLREWHVRYARAYLDLGEGMTQAQTFRDRMRVNDIAEDDLIDALMAYDRMGVLGSRHWIENNLTLEQVILMLQRITRAHA